ncbi:hypothetical protein KC345_g88 [Hortaea werneckii]|nr:hypothetical protein KC345_g88 [Hortaea werneckii]
MSSILPISFAKFRLEVDPLFRLLVLYDRKNPTRVAKKQICICICYAARKIENGTKIAFAFQVRTVSVRRGVTQRERLRTVLVREVVLKQLRYFAVSFFIGGRNRQRRLHSARGEVAKMTGDCFQTFIQLRDHAHSTTRVKDPTSRVRRVKDPSDEVSSRRAIAASIAFNTRRAAVHLDRTSTTP